MHPQSEDPMNRAPVQIVIGDDEPLAREGCGEMLATGCCKRGLLSRFRGDIRAIGPAA